MQCANHPNRTASENCAVCQKALCVFCVEEQGGRVYCASHAPRPSQTEAGRADPVTLVSPGPDDRSALFGQTDEETGSFAASAETGEAIFSTVPVEEQPSPGEKQLQNESIVKPPRGNIPLAEGRDIGFEPPHNRPLSVSSLIAQLPRGIYAGNNSDLLGLIGIIVGGITLLSCFTCGAGIYCLPIVGFLMGLAGILSAKDALDQQRTKKLSLITMIGSGVLLLITALCVVGYVLFYVGIFALSANSGGI